jgi:hypothetical protein
MIPKLEAGKWVLRSRDGTKVLGRFDTKEKAEEHRVGRFSEAMTAESLEGQAELVRAAWAEKQPSYDAAWYPCDVFDDHMVVRKDLMYRSLPYSIEGQAVIFGEPAEVAVSYEPVGEAVPLGQSMNPTGSVWDVRVLKFGKSRNGWLWTREAGEKLLALLPSAPVGCYVFQAGMAHASEEAVMSADGPLARNIVGDLQDPRIEPDGVYAQLHVHEDAGWLKTKLLGLQARGVVDKVLGLSVDTLAGYVPVQLREGAAKAIKEIGRLISVDIVTAPSADGRFLRATAGPLLMPTHNPQEDLMTREQIFALIEANRPQLLAGRSREAITDETLQLLLGDALKLAAPGTASSPAAVAVAPAAVAVAAPAAQVVAPAWASDMERRYAVSTTQARVLEALHGATSLGELSRERIRKRFADKVADTTEIAAVIAEEREFVARLAESGEVRGFGHTRAEILAAPRDKVQAALDRLIFRDVTVNDLEAGLSLKNAPFSPDTTRRILESWKPQREAMKDRGLEFGGLRDAYVTITGDQNVSGVIQRGRASEAIMSTTWAEILANTLYRRFLLEYSLPVYNERAIAEFGSASDFRTKETVVLGYFGDIADVDPENADYVEIDPPGDDKVSYAVTQRGNILTISRKTIINDDMRAVSKLVARLGRAARRTLARYIWNFWLSNAVYDVDSIAWFNSSHGNTGSTALTVDLTGANEVLAKIIQLADMTEQGSLEKLGMPPMESLWLDVPHALYGKALQINNSREFGAGNINPVMGMFGASGERINVNPLFTDTTDWGVHVSPGAAGRESIQVDFLQGREEPEFFLADQPTVGQAFIGDKIQYKLRHEYGGDVQDFRGATKNVVAGS